MPFGGGGSRSGGSGAVTQIASTTAAATVASLGFTGITQTFNHLQLVVANARSDLTTAAGIISLRINNDSAGSYDFINAIAFGAAGLTASANAAATSARVVGVTSSTAVAGATAQTELFFPNYTGTTFYKTWTGKGGRKDADAASNMAEETASGAYRSTAAITALSVAAFGTSGTAQNFLPGASAFLYGIT